MIVDGKRRSYALRQVTVERKVGIPLVMMLDAILLVSLALVEPVHSTLTASWLRGFKGSYHNKLVNMLEPFCSLNERNSPLLIQWGATHVGT